MPHIADLRHTDCRLEQKEPLFKTPKEGLPFGGPRRKNSMQEIDTSPMSAVTNSERDGTLSRPEKKKQGATNLNKLVKKQDMVEL